MDGHGTGEPVRYRLLQADGTSLELRMVDDPAPAVAGPGVVMIDDFEGWNGGMAGVEHLYLIDDRSGTLRPLDVPEEVRYWGPDPDEFLWGVTDDCQVFWTASGEVQHRRLECSDGPGFTAIPTASSLDGWARAGRMVVAELRDDRLEDQMFLHVSLDSGDHWQRIPVAGEEDIADALQRLR